MQNRRLLLAPHAAPTQRTYLTLKFSDSLVKQAMLKFTSEPRSLFAYQVMATPSVKLNAMPAVRIQTERDVILLSKFSKENFT